MAFHFRKFLYATFLGFKKVVWYVNIDACVKVRASLDSVSGTMYIIRLRSITIILSISNLYLLAAISK